MWVAHEHRNKGRRGWRWGTKARLCAGLSGSSMRGRSPDSPKVNSCDGLPPATKGRSRFWSRGMGRWFWAFAGVCSAIAAMSRMPFRPHSSCCYARRGLCATVSGLGPGCMAWRIAWRHGCEHVRSGGPARSVRAHVPRRWNQSRTANWNGARFADFWMRRSTGCPRIIAARSCFVTLRANRTRRRRGDCGARRGACAGGSTVPERSCASA